MTFIRIHDIAQLYHTVSGIKTVSDLPKTETPAEVILCNLNDLSFMSVLKKAYTVLMTGETAIYANIILKKGVVTE